MRQIDPQNPTGLVLNIQHFCTHDGPGMRTTVFLKACSLRCKWCSNPGSINPKPELAYDSKKCIGKKQCGFCLKPPFPEGAFYVSDEPDDKVQVNWDLASECSSDCASICPTGAIYVFGQEMTVEQVLDEVEQDSSFYHESGGGITKFIARTPLIPGVNDDEAHIRAVLAFIKPYKNVIDYELLPYHRFGESKYSFLGRVYEMDDFKSPTEESLVHLRAIIDEAFGRSNKA